MDLGIKDKVALVTGASTGLGFAAALALANEGANLVINSRSRANLDIAADKIEKETGCQPMIIDGDLTKEGVAESVIQKTIENLGTMDILVSNAGGPSAGEFMQLGKEAWDDCIALTLLPALNLARAAIPEMTKKHWGRIIFITSISVKQPIDNLIISNTLRAGVTGFAKSISNELAGKGITVNTVCPGFTDTERLGELAQVKSKASGKSIKEIYADWVESIPAGRVGRPEELAALIAFLASEKAAYITGTTTAVDGGYAKGLL